MDNVLSKNGVKCAVFKFQAIKSNFLSNNKIMEDTKCITFYSIDDINADGEKIRIVQKLSDYILKFYLKKL